MGKNNEGNWLKLKDQVNGLLDKGCSFEGKISFDGTVQINGDFSGEIVSEGTLVVGQDANIQGNVFVNTLVCYGTVRGKVEAKNRIEIHLPSVVTANIITKTLLIEEGAVFQGQCHMNHESAEKNISSEKTTNGSVASSHSVQNGDTPSFAEAI